MLIEVYTVQPDFPLCLLHEDLIMFQALFFFLILSLLHPAHTFFSLLLYPTSSLLSLLSSLPIHSSSVFLQKRAGRPGISTKVLYFDIKNRHTDDLLRCGSNLCSSCV